MSKKLTPLLAALSLIPLVLTTLAVLFWLPDTIPTHAGFGGVNSYGSKFEAFIGGGLLTAFSLLLTLSYYHAEKLMALGLIHGTNVKGGRIVMFASVILFDVVSVMILFFWLS
jgi:hypothetical protein